MKYAKDLQRSVKVPSLDLTNMIGSGVIVEESLSNNGRNSKLVNTTDTRQIRDFNTQGTPGTKKGQTLELKIEDCLPPPISPFARLSPAVDEDLL